MKAQKSVFQKITTSFASNLSLDRNLNLSTDSLFKNTLYLIMEKVKPSETYYPTDLEGQGDWGVWLVLGKHRGCDIAFVYKSQNLLMERVGYRLN